MSPRFFSIPFMIFFSKKNLRFLRKNIFVSDTKLQNVQINEEEEFKKEREEIEERSETAVNEKKLKILKQKWLFFETRIKKEVKKRNQKKKEEETKMKNKKNDVDKKQLTKGREKQIKRWSSNMTL